ncbi:MAG: GNAT family N-acetyltransferase [Pseudomonadota bacterium]
MKIKQIIDDTDLADFSSIMMELRTHIDTHEEIVKRMHTQMSTGYCLLGYWENDLPAAVAGYRVQESLTHGKYMCVDDFVVSSVVRNKGIGSKLLDYLLHLASHENCNKLVLDSAMSNHLAQRFYYGKNMKATALHFSYDLN